MSVIIPTYNCGHFLGAAIDSVLSQTGVSLEVIVVDDGSTDDTQAVVRSYGDHVRYEAQPKSGVSAARNRGLALAQGEFVVFLDADDTFLPNKLAEQVTCFDGSKRIGIVHSGWDVVTHNGELITQRRPWEDAPKLNLITWLLWKPVYPGALMFRRNWLEMIGGYDVTLSHAEDVDLVLRLALAGCKAKWLKRSTVRYRRHAGNTSSAAIEQARGIHTVLDKFFSDDNVPRSVLKHKAKIYHSTSQWAAWYLYRFGEMDEAVGYLRMTFRHVDVQNEKKVLHWLSQFLNFAIQANGEERTLTEMVALFRNAIDIDDERWQEIETVVRWWTGVWWHYHRNAHAEAVRCLATYGSLERQEVIDACQYCLLVSPFSVNAVEVNRFWADGMRLDLIPHARRFDIALLHLSVFAQHVWARRWGQALRSLGWAVRTGWHPRAAYVWRRFLRGALTYYLLQPRDA